jgi:hypothetical protein
MTGRAIARVLIDRARTGGESPRGMLIEEIDGVPPAAHPIAKLLAEAGFISGALGMQAKLQHGSHQPLSSVVSRKSPVLSREPSLVSRSRPSPVLSHDDTSTTQTSPETDD